MFPTFADEPRNHTPLFERSPDSEGTLAESDIFNDVLSSNLEMAGGAPAYEFIEGMLTDMPKHGIQMDDHKFQLMMKSAFGAKEDLARKIAQLTPDAFANHYPEPTGSLVIAYINGQSWTSFWDSLS